MPATTCHAFLTSTTQSSVPIQIRRTSHLFQQQYYDQNGQDYYLDTEGNPYYYDDQGNPYYAQDPQQQQYYNEQQQQQQQYNQNEDQPLLITGNMQEEMARATNGVELGGIDYLALARQRAAARVESTNDQSSDADWIQLAEEKKRQKGGYGSDDEDWEKSLDDEGSMSDSAALGMGVKLEEYEEGGGAMVTEGGLIVDNMGGDEGGDGPQLLL